mmetsp:Transcript_5515/g.13270  ORF Transcript_5515/g.13270 Transcript_5515/m.13270 type:complete len:205 (+) Transcript_5515:1916-2530(+)
MEPIQKKKALTTFTGTTLIERRARGSHTTSSSQRANTSAGKSTPSTNSSPYASPMKQLKSSFFRIYLSFCFFRALSIRRRSFFSATFLAWFFFTSSSKPMSDSLIFASLAALVTEPSIWIAVLSVISVHLSIFFPVVVSAACTNETSFSDTRLMARPRWPALAVLPMRCTYEIGFLGSSALITRSTVGMSKPRAARSVATQTRT